MNRRLKRNVALGGVGLLVAAGGGAAYAASSANDPQAALLSDAAKRLNVTPEQLRSALQGAFGDQLDQAVKDGKLTQKQADHVKQDVARGGGLPPLGGPPPGAGELLFRGGPPHGGGMMLGPIGPGLDAAATYLGLTRAQLRARLEQGDSLADVAKAQGKDVDGLRQALVDAAKADLDKAVADGRLTATQRDEILKEMTEHVDDLVQGKGPGPGGPRFELHGPGPGGPGFGTMRHGSASAGGSDSSNESGSYDSAPSADSGAA